MPLPCPAPTAATVGQPASCRNPSTLVPTTVADTAVEEFVTSTMRPYGSGSRRAIPSRPTPAQREALREWLAQEQWVLRPVWERWLATQQESLKTPLECLTRNQHDAARAWLRQQRHALHEATESGPAPDGWLEEQPLYRAIMRQLDAEPSR